MRDFPGVSGRPCVQVDKFEPKDNVKIETDPNAKGDGEGAVGPQDDEARIAQLCAQLDGLRQQLPDGFRVTPVVFEKDDDSNFHMDLITALANMRARNYSIPEVRQPHTPPVPHGQHPLPVGLRSQPKRRSGTRDRVVLFIRHSSAGDGVAHRCTCALLCVCAPGLHSAARSPGFRQHTAVCRNRTVVAPPGRELVAVEQLLQPG